VKIWTFLLWAIASLMALPIAVILFYLVTPSGEIWSHLAETVLPGYVTNSLVLMVWVGAGTLVIGAGAAWLITMTHFAGRRFFEWALIMPLAIPAYVIAFTYTGLLEYAGPVQTLLRDFFGWQSSTDYWFFQIRSLTGAAAMMTLVFYPYVYMLARAAFLEQSVSVLDAARTLGKGAWGTVFHMALPLARPAIMGGLALALMETLNDFGTVQFFAVDTFVTGIYRTWMNLGEPKVAAQLGAILMLFVLALLVLEKRSRKKRVTHTVGAYKNLPRFALSKFGAAAAFVFCLVPVFFGFLVPVAAMIVWTIQTSKYLDTAFFQMTVTSLSLSGITALAAVVTAILLAYGQRLMPANINFMAVRLATMGYAVPGAVIALGIMIPFTFLDNFIDRLSRQFFDHATGLILTGTWAALIFAYVVRFLAVSFNTVESSMTKVTPSMDGVSRTLGMNAGQTLWRVHTPIMRPSLLTAAVLVFVDVMKELPATFMMRPFGLQTLAIRSYELASDGLIKESSGSSLAIVVAGIIPVIILSLMISKSRPGQKTFISGKP
jgi:iron(III) transport system permease protein